MVWLTPVNNECWLATKLYFTEFLGRRAVIVWYCVEGSRDRHITADWHSAQRHHNRWLPRNILWWPRNGGPSPSTLLHCCTAVFCPASSKSSAFVFIPRILLKFFAKCDGAFVPSCLTFSAVSARKVCLLFIAGQKQHISNKNQN